MDCHSATTTVDLCSELECTNSTVTFKATDRKSHLPSHGMFKVHRIIFDRDMGRIERNARDALNSIQGTLSELKEAEKPMPECVQCKNTISLPCWGCVDCTGEKFICDNCEHKGLAFNETHTKMHTLVRVSEQVEETEVSMEDRLHLVEDELMKMRELLTKLIEMGAGASPTKPLTMGDLQAAAAEVACVQSDE